METSALGTWVAIIGKGDGRITPQGDFIPDKPAQARMTAITPEALHAFFELYYGLQEANENGTGYSPRVAQAIKTLKPYFERAEAKAAG